jgi:cytochrome bd-type quinol oxidase subunit 2
MKSTTVAIGLFAGLTSAFNNHHPRHFHAPRALYARNATTNGVEAAAAQTTLTVDVTSTHTVISCAATITNCPGRNNTAAYATMPASALTTVLVTEVIDLTTTVCPVTAAESISSALVASHSGGLITGNTHYPTVTATASGVSVTSAVATKDTTLTMTIGGENSKSVVVTTIHSTYTEMITVVC